jgi:Domain of unknown function (DUF4262)
MTGISREAMRERIRSNIEKHGYHLYLIAGKQVPRFAYTIGVSPAKGSELILAGAAIYSNEDLNKIIEDLVSLPNLAAGSSMEIDSLGTFLLRKVDGSWSGLLALGALDYYRGTAVRCLQVVPDKDHWTIDIPDLSRPWSKEAEPVWPWLSEPWDYPVPDRSVAVTNLDALRGKPVTEATRWEVDQWEMFAGAGPDVPPDDIREVPLGTLLAADPSLTAVTALQIGKGLWRDPADLEWHSWGE